MTILLGKVRSPRFRGVKSLACMLPVSIRGVGWGAKTEPRVAADVAMPVSTVNYTAALMTPSWGRPSLVAPVYGIGAANLKAWSGEPYTD
jgi:hypothetical protein